VAVLLWEVAPPRFKEYMNYQRIPDYLVTLQDGSSISVTFSAGVNLEKLDVIIGVLTLTTQQFKQQAAAAPDAAQEGAG
jgi:hypothetical protein